MSPPATLAADDRVRRAPARLRLLSDERLAARAAAGDERAFDELFRRHQPGVLSFCRYLLGSRDEAQDAVQQSFMRLLGALRRERPPAELRPFLYAIARNRCRTILAGRREEPPVDDRMPDVAGLADQVQQRDDLRALVADIGRLPEEQRAALVLAELGDLSHDGIAQALDVPEARVRALIYQAKAHLLAEREARERSCDEVRAEIATASGAALRRAPLRRHLRRCSGCRAFRAGISRQRAQLAIVLPVAAGTAVEGGLAGGAAVLGAGAGAAAVAGSGGGGLLGGLGAVKTAAVVAALGVGAAGGTAVVEQARDDVPPATAAAAPPSATPERETAAPPPGSVPALVPAPAASAAPRSADTAGGGDPRPADPGRERGRMVVATGPGDDDKGDEHDEARREREKERRERKDARREQEHEPRDGGADARTSAPAGARSVTGKGLRDERRDRDRDGRNSVVAMRRAGDDGDDREGERPARARDAEKRHEKHEKHKKPREHGRGREDERPGDKDD